jgi:hypothetical protein
MGFRTQLNDLFQKATGVRLMEARRDRRRFFRSFAELRLRAIYGAISELRARELPREGGESGEWDLRTAELKVFSQNGEDGIIHQLLQYCRPEVVEYFVEFGVESGAECNTRLLAEVYGWHGAYIEPDVAGFAALQRRYAYSRRVRCMRAAVTPSNVDELFRQLSVPEKFGVLSIDVDGQDFWIWTALPARYQPAIVVIECNTGVDLDLAIAEREGWPWSRRHTANFGASIAALRELGDRRGYQLVHVDLTGINAFFVRSELLDRREANLVGVIERSPNYGLAGKGHPTEGARPTVTVPTS